MGGRESRARTSYQTQAVDVLSGVVTTKPNTYPCTAVLMWSRVSRLLSCHKIRGFIIAVHL